MTRTFISEAYKIGKESSLIYEEFGRWSEATRLVDLRETRVLSKRRRDLQGHRFIASTVYIKEGQENLTDLDDYQYENKIHSLIHLPLLILYVEFWFVSVTTKSIQFQNYLLRSQNIGSSR